MTVTASVLHARTGWTLEMAADDCVCDAEVEWTPGSPIPTHCEVCNHRFLADERAELETLLTMETV